MSNPTENNKYTKDNPHPPERESLNTPKPTATELLEIAKKWHVRIHEELATPILPNDLDKDILNRKLKEISRQREKHKIYQKVLEKLIRNNKPARES